MKIVIENISDCEVVSHPILLLKGRIDNLDEDLFKGKVSTIDYSFF